MQAGAENGGGAKVLGRYKFKSRSWAMKKVPLRAPCDESEISTLDVAGIGDDVPDVLNTGDVLYRSFEAEAETGMGN